jgi:hypothetical protein
MRRSGDPPPGFSPETAAGDPEQSKRFVEAACQLGCEEGFDRLDEALKRVGTTPPQTQEQPAKWTGATKSLPETKSLT